MKSKIRFARDGLIFDLDEVRKLRTFARLFHLRRGLPVSTRKADRGLPGASWPARLGAAVRRGKTLTLGLPLGEALPVSLEGGFLEAFVRAITPG